MVVAEATASKRPAASWVKIVSNAVSTHRTSSSKRPAISSTSSTSRPVSSPPSRNSNGGEGMSEPTGSTPPSTVSKARPPLARHHPLFAGLEGPPLLRLRRAGARLPRVVSSARGGEEAHHHEQPAGENTQVPHGYPPP